MPIELWLGPSGSEILLPTLNWVGEPGTYPETLKKNFEQATMGDGRIRVDFKEKDQREWPLAWGELTRAWVDTIQAMVDLRQPLRFWNGLMVNPLWLTVAVKSYLPVLRMDTFKIGYPEKYRATLVLEEEDA